MLSRRQIGIGIGCILLLLFISWMAGFLDFLFNDPSPSPTPLPTSGPTPGVAPTPTSGVEPSPTPGVAPTPTSGPTPGVAPAPTSGPTPTPSPGVAPSPTSGPTPTPTSGPTPTPSPVWIDQWDDAGARAAATTGRPRPPCIGTKKTPNCAQDGTDPDSCNGYTTYGAPSGQGYQCVWVPNKPGITDKGSCDSFREGSKVMGYWVRNARSYMVRDRECTLTGRDAQDAALADVFGEPV